jgi:CubicO group peptidase (beta-lactamase class C family)
VREQIQTTLDYWRVPGAVVAFVSNDTEGVEVFGIKDVEGNAMDADVSKGAARRTPHRARRTARAVADEQTYLSIGSNSKWVTALALATMEVWGNVTLPDGDAFTLDARIKDIWPEFKMQDANATENATVADFLSESAGTAHVRPFRLCAPADSQPCAPVSRATTSPSAAPILPSTRCGTLVSSTRPCPSRPRSSSTLPSTSTP